MQQTANYALPQWEADDAVKRSDLNSAMTTLDAAVADSSRFVKLKEVSVASISSSYTLSLSGIDWDKWQYVHVDFASSNSSTGNLYANTETQDYRIGTLGFSGYVNGEKAFQPRLTFTPGRTAARFVCGTYYGSFTVSNLFFKDLTSLVFVATMSRGMRVVIWGEA